MAWSRNQYINSFTNTDSRKGVYHTNNCNACTTPWYECASYDKCSLCTSGYYLSLDTTGGMIGSCNAKLSTAQTLNIFVSPGLVETTNTGTYESPFGNIVKALSYANDYSANAGTTTVNVYLLGGGSHYMTRNFNHYHYNQTKNDKISFNQDINIQPAFCGTTVGGHTFGSADSDCIASGSKITVYYMMGNTYEFIVPKSLTIQNIIFDALDSSIDPTDSWLQENNIWWTLSGTTMSINSTATVIASNCSVASLQTEEWKSTFGNSFFQFGLSDQSEISTVGTLTITSCEFQHFFYDFTSFIGLNNGNGHVVITGSKFDKFSNCGSIIRDTRQYPVLDYSSNSLGSTTSVSYRSSAFSMSISKNKRILVTSTACTTATWASIKISTSTFSNFNYMKSSANAYHKVASSSTMVYQGIIVNLANFYGSVTLNNNTFSSLQFKYSNCEDIYTSNTNLDSDQIWGEIETILQAKTLIFVQVRTGQIEIFGNSFTSWNSLQGLVWLKRKPDYNTPILINSNTFTRNSALESGANAIKIDLFTNQSFQTTFSQTDMICASVQISSNTFTQNVGWFNTTGAIQAVWYNEAQDGDPSDSYPNHWREITPMSNVTANNIQKSGIVAFTTVNNVVFTTSSITVDKNKFELKSNTYTENFAGLTSTIVSLTGIRRVHIVSETYQHNTGIYKEALSAYGTISSSGTVTGSNYPGAWFFKAYFESGQSTSLNTHISDANQQNYYPDGVLEIHAAFYISISGTTFDNNKFFEQELDDVTNYYRSNAISIVRSNGEVYFSSVTFQNYEGWDLTRLEAILGSTEYANVVTGGPETRGSDGIPTTSATSPSYNIDYGCKYPFINLGYTSTESTSIFRSSIDQLTIASLTATNISHYTPRDTVSVILSAKNDVTSLTITSPTFSDVSDYRGSQPLFSLTPRGTLSFTGGTFTNINKDAYDLDSTNHNYLPSNGAVFSINSFTQDDDYGTLSYTFSDITFSGIYAKRGGAFYLSKDTGVTNSHAITLVLNNNTIQNSYSLTSGMIYSPDNGHSIQITSSTFSSNTGVNGEADLYFMLATSISVTDTKFEKFSSSVSSGSLGQSISIAMARPYAITVQFTNVTVKWSDTAFDADLYRGYTNNTSTYFTKNAPIFLGPGQLKTINSTFSNWFNSQSGGVLKCDTSSVYEDDGSTYKESASTQGGAIAFVNSQMNLTGTTFDYDFASNGGAISMDSSTTTTAFSSVTCSHSEAINFGGWIYLIGSSSLTATGSTFSENYSQNTASAIYALGSSANTITNCTFNKNTAVEGNTISLLFSDTTLDTIVLKDNEVFAESTGIFITFWTVSIINSTFTTETYPNGAANISEAAKSAFSSGWFISISAGATLTMTTSTLTNGYAVNGGFIYVSGNSEMTLTTNTFTSGYAGVSGGAIYASSFKQITITSWTFTSNVAFNEGSILYLNSGTTVITGSTFNASPNYNAVNIVAGNFTGTTLTFSNSNPSGSSLTQNLQGGGIYASNPATFFLDQSKFENLNYSQFGGAIYLAFSTTNKPSAIPSEPTWNITSSNFTSNSASFGGAVYVDDVDFVRFTSCKFTSNTAVILNNQGGDGAGLYYAATDTITQVVFETGNEFTSNSAGSSGGGIFWNYNTPKNLSQVTFTSNTASKYGNNYGCFAQVLKSINSTQYSSQTSSRRFLGTLSGTTSLTLSSQQSGGSLGDIYLALVDEFDQIVGSDSSSTVTIAISGTHTGATYTPTITGTTSLTFSNGVVNYGDLTFTAEPGSNYSLTFTTTGIDATKPSNAAYLTANSQTSTAMAFAIQLRTWITGESFQTSGAWVEWASPDFYSLSSLSSPADCKDCQTDRMFWNGGSDIGPRPGYWRSSNTSDDFIECLYKPACLGYESTYNNSWGQCFTGYQGKLCADCKAGFSRTGDYEWGKCPDPVWNIIRIVLVMTGVTVGLVILIKSTLAGALQRKNIQSVYIKLMMNHLQLIILASSFNFDWPSRVLKLFETTEPVAKVSQQIISFDCFLDQRSDSDTTNSNSCEGNATTNDGNLIRIYYQKMIIFALLPLLLALGSFIFWSLYFCRKSRAARTKKTSRIMATLIILFFLVHPTIVENMFSNFK